MSNSDAPALTPLGRIIREQGRLKGWVAQQLECDPSRLSRLISGDSKLTLEEAARAAKALGVSLEDLMETGEDS